MDGWTVSTKTVADSMRRQGLIARRIRRRNGLTRQDKTAPKFPDLLKRDFSAGGPNARWVGDMTEIPTDGAEGLHPDADLAPQAIKMAVTARSGKTAIWCEEETEKVIFPTDRG